MSWMEKLYQTYENCQSHIGKEESGGTPLLPICHTTQIAHIEVVLDENATFMQARVLSKNENTTIIPCTEASAGRTGRKPPPHPLCDKLQYVAGDYVLYGCEVTSGFSKQPSEPHQMFMSQLSHWCNSDYKHPKTVIVHKYLSKACLISDLCGAGILSQDKNTGKLEEAWDGQRGEKPEIYSVLAPGLKPEDAFVRWCVEIPGDTSRLWEDKSLWDSWISYYNFSSQSTGELCYAT